MALIFLALFAIGLLKIGEKEKRRKGEEETEEVQSAIGNRQSAMSSSFILHPLSFLWFFLSLCAVCGGNFYQRAVFADGIHGSLAAADAPSAYKLAQAVVAEFVCGSHRRVSVPGAVGFAEGDGAGSHALVLLGILVEFPAAYSDDWTDMLVFCRLVFVADGRSHACVHAWPVGLGGGGAVGPQSACGFTRSAADLGGNGRLSGAWICLMAACASLAQCRLPFLYVVAAVDAAAVPEHHSRALTVRRAIPGGDSTRGRVWAARRRLRKLSGAAVGLETVFGCAVRAGRGVCVGSFAACVGGVLPAVACICWVLFPLCRCHSRRHTAMARRHGADVCGNACQPKFYARPGRRSIRV